MKYLSFIFFIFISCSRYQNKNKENKKLNNISGEKLIKSDFLKYSDSLKKDSLKIKIIKSFDIYDEDNNKSAFIDAEELSEFNFDFFMPRINRILSKRNIKLRIEIASDYENSNTIFINGQKIKLYTKTELKTGKNWETAPSNFFRRINDILKENSIKERFYLLYEGNDLSTLLLTENQFKIISTKYKNNKNEIPYLP